VTREECKMTKGEAKWPAEIVIVSSQRQKGLGGKMTKGEKM
jgi:hypothetical protein